jgi:hypothetical protein
MFNLFISVGSVVIGAGEPLTLAEFRGDWWMAAVGFLGGLAAIVAVVRRVAPWPWQLAELSGDSVTRKPLRQGN